MANIDGLYTNQGNGVWGSNNQIIGTTRVLAFSTTTPLGANAVYTSPTIDAINYKYHSGLITADQAGSFFIQYSDDGVTWYNSSLSASTLAANAVNLPSFFNALRYLRYVYTNGAAAQTIFKLSIYQAPL